MARLRKAKRRRAADHLPADVLLYAVAVGRSPSKLKKADWKRMAGEFAWRLRPGIIENAMAAPAAKREGRRPLFETDQDALEYYQAASRLHHRSGLTLEKFFEDRLRVRGEKGRLGERAKRLAEQLRNLGRKLKRQGLL